MEEELFVSGGATVYTYEEQPRREVVVPREPGVPYKTRLIVRRPADPARFSGTVVVEWWNSTASFDSAPVWDASAEFFAREGWIYVGVTNSNTPIAFLRAAAGSAASCPSRTAASATRRWRCPRTGRPTR